MDQNEDDDPETPACCSGKRCSQNELFTPTFVFNLRCQYHTLASSEDRFSLLRNYRQSQMRTRAESVTRWVPSIDGIIVCFGFCRHAFLISLDTLNKSLLGDSFARAAPAPVNEKTRKEGIVCEWLDRFASYHEILPDHSFIMLPYSNRRDVYNFFVADSLALPNEGLPEVYEHMKLEKCSKSYFFKVWATKRQHIILRKYLLFAKCDICVQNRIQRGISVDLAVIEKRKNDMKLHLEYIKMERDYYTSKKDQARLNPCEYLSLVLDGSDQSAYGIPHFREISKTTATAHKMKCHLVGVISQFTFPPAIPKNFQETFQKENLIQLKRGLEACSNRLTDSQYKETLEYLTEMEEQDPIHFHWTLSGQFKCERLRSFNNQQQIINSSVTAFYEETDENEEDYIPVLRSRATDAQTVHSMDNLKIGDYVVCGAELNEDNSQRFYVAKVLSIDENQRNIQIHWFESDKEFGCYRPCMNGKKKFTDNKPRNIFYYRFDLTKNNTIPKQVMELMKQITQIFDDE